MSQTCPTVFHSSKSNLLHAIPMMSMCASHNVIEAQLNRSRVMPLFSFFYISIFYMTNPGKGVYSSQFGIALV